MISNSSARVTRTPRRSWSLLRTKAAREAIRLCETADALAREASEAVGIDDDRLFSLLEQREQMLADLSEQLLTLRLERPTADSPLFSATERMVDEADELVANVCAVLKVSQRTTMALAVRVSERVAELRQELQSVQQAGSANLGYSVFAATHHVDRRR